MTSHMTSLVCVPTFKETSARVRHFLNLKFQLAVVSRNVGKLKKDQPFEVLIALTVYKCRQVVRNNGKRNGKNDGREKQLWLLNTNVAKRKKRR